MRPAAPDSTNRSSRTRSGTADRMGSRSFSGRWARPKGSPESTGSRRGSQVVGPPDAERAHEHAPQDERPPPPADRAAGDDPERGERPDERDRVEEVPVAELEPAAAVVEQGRDEHEDGGGQQRPGTPV